MCVNVYFSEQNISNRNTHNNNKNKHKNNIFILCFPNKKLHFFDTQMLDAVFSLHAYCDDNMNTIMTHMCDWTEGCKR